MIRPSTQAQPGTHTPDIQHLSIQVRQERSSRSYGTDTPEQAIGKAIDQHLRAGAADDTTTEIAAILSLMQEFRLTMRQAWGAWVKYNANAVTF